LSVLAMAVLYSIYFVVKRSVEDPDRSMSISAFYATAAFASVPIVLIAPSIFPALHPATSTAVEALGAPIARLLDVSMALALSLLALYIAGARVPKPVAYLSLAIAASVAAAIGAQYLQPVYVVYGASVAGNVVVMNTSEGVLSVPLSRVDLRPLFVNGTSTLVGHLVAPNGAIVVHWSVAVNVLIAGAAVLALSVSGRHEP
ncbi:MAG: cytochrome c biogenesis protein CcsA, partial [Thermoproteus sp.]